MNRYKLNISSNSIMLLRTYDPTQSTHKNNSNDSIKSINQLNLYVELFRKTFGFVDIFELFWINWVHSITPVAQNQSTQSPTVWKRIDSITNQLAWKRNWINSINFMEKVNRFKSINSIEMIGLKIWIGPPARRWLLRCCNGHMTRQFFYSKSETSLTDVVCELFWNGRQWKHICSINVTTISTSNPKAMATALQVKQLIAQCDLRMVVPFAG